MAQASSFSKSYNSFSGADIKAVIGSTVMAELQGISYSVTREKAPIYTMGSPDPRSFSRGKRGLAGTLIFVVFDRHAILSNLGGYAPNGGLKFQSDIDDIRPDFVNLGNPSISSMQPLSSSQGTTATGQAVREQESPISTVGGDQELAGAWFADQIPPFDVTIAAANEYGALAVMRIFGIELLNEGSGFSVDDMVIEQQHTYVARTMIGWSPVASPNVARIANQWT